MSDASSANNTASFTLGEVLAATKGTLFGGECSLRVSGVSSDTRLLRPNSLFVALRGERFDGHNFLNEAHSAGAVAAIIETSPFDIKAAEAKKQLRDDLALIRVLNSLQSLGELARFHRERFHIPVIGVTGSYGKTTTRAFIAAALSPLGEILASRENFNNEIGVPQTLFGLNENHKAAIVEMGMRGLGQIEYLADIARPTIGVITNIGPQHIELLGNLENIARAKAELIENLPADGVAVLPDEGAYCELLQEIAREKGCRVITFGTSNNADVRVSSTRTTENGNVEAEFKIENSKFRILLPLPGVHNATNAAAAFAVAYELGVDLNEAARALESVEVPGARMRVLRANELTILDDCYNAGPDSMRVALETLRDFPDAKRRVAVLGAMKELGEFSEDEHRKLGVLASQICDLVIYVGEETRAALDATTVETFWCENAAEAAHRVLDVVESGDVVLVKGSRSVRLELVVSALVR